MSRVLYPPESSGSTSAGLNQAAHGGHSGPSTSFFGHAQNTTFTNSQVNMNINHIQARSTGLHVLGKNSALGAIYNSLERERLDPPKCHPNTRKAVIKKIIDWICGIIDSKALILWLYGAAGAGKSAIAHTLAEICENYGWLVASFFFWKTASERNNANRFVATIAHQVALAIPASREFIRAAVDHNPFIFKQSIDVQLSKLIIEPLDQLVSAGIIFDASPLVIIIDGLDECEGNDVQSGIVKSLAAAFCRSPLRIRILIASRPEVHLQSTFNSSSIHPRLQVARLALSGEYSPEEDVYRFLEDSFEKIRREHPLASHIPPFWPSTDVLRELTKKSSGQFIFASTTVKYVGGDPHQLPHRRLDVIRQLRPPKGEKDMPYAELNSLYHHVLSSVDDMDAVKQVLGVLIIVNPIVKKWADHMETTCEMDELLGWESGETEACLSQLASIIECDRYGSISILHASLSDFLLDPSRSNQAHLCRESVLGDYAALALQHVRQGRGDTQHSWEYFYLAESCINDGAVCTPRLQQELSQLSFQSHYHDRAGGTDPEPYWMHAFWFSASSIVEMLHKQNLEERNSHLISDLSTVCLEAFQNYDPHSVLIVLIYEAQYPHICRVQVSNSALMSHLIDPKIKPRIREIIKRIVMLHPERQRLEFTGLHYAWVAWYLINYSLSYRNFTLRLCSSAEAFNEANDWDKERHSHGLSALLCIAHVLPLACKYENIIKYIRGSRDCARTSEEWGPSLHMKWSLDGWNDYIIQPARDAALAYYTRYAEPSDVEEYMRLNDLS